MSKRFNKKVIKGEPLEDRIGKYYGVCTYRSHLGIVRYSYYKTCEKRNCEYYKKYRET
jgi:hypothetical protein